MENLNQKSFSQQAGQPISRQEVMKSFPKKRTPPSLIVGSLLVVLFGIASGWFLSRGSVSGTNKPSVAETTGVEQSDKEAGILDESTFEESESPEGILQEGGIEGEGTHRLERPGGPSQNVYLTSTVIDLQSYVGKKVKVWGETLSAVRAGWLMDVGKIKVLD